MDTNLTMVNQHLELEPKTESEQALANLLKARGAAFDYEKWQFWIPELEEPFTPDVWLPVLGVFIEVSMAGGTDGRKRHRHLQKKRQKILSVHRRLGIPVILLHGGNWPEPRDDWGIIAKIISDTRVEATRIHDEWIHNRP